MADEFVRRAQELVSEQLAKHPDEGVRAINMLCDPPEDHPTVLRVAEMLRARAAPPEARPQ